MKRNTASDEVGSTWTLPLEEAGVTCARRQEFCFPKCGGKAGGLSSGVENLLSYMAVSSASNRKGLVVRVPRCAVVEL